MKIVKPSEEVCLLLDSTYMPFAVITARAAFYHTFKRHGQGFTIDRQVFTYDNVLNNTVTISENQPMMRSAHAAWVIAIAFKLDDHFFRGVKKLKKKKTVTLRDLFYHYRGVCQYCGRRKSLHDFSKDHYYPKSKGGSDDDFNLILSCKACNSHKSDKFPYKNHKGEIVKPKGFYKTGFYLKSEPREEWKPFLFLDEFSDEEKEKIAKNA